MKKGTIIALVVAIVLIIAGGTVLMLGLSFAGNSEDSVTMVTESRHTISESFDSVLIDTEDCNVDIVLLEGAADPHVVLKERDRTSHSVLVEDGTLKIRMMDNRSWRDFIGVNWESMEMTVYLPQKQYESVRITTATGRIQIPEGFRIRQARLHSDTGRIMCSADMTENLGCFTATGSITVQNGSPAILTLESDTGKIRAYTVAATEVHVDNDTGKTELEIVSSKLLTCKSETGDVELEDVMAEEYLQIRTTTGDVGIENCDAGRVDIETDTGDVEGHFLTPKWFSARSDTGDVDVPISRDGGECRIESDTGDIHFQ